MKPSNPQFSTHLTHFHHHPRHLLICSRLDGFLTDVRDGGGRHPEPTEAEVQRTLVSTIQILRRLSSGTTFSLRGWLWVSKTQKKRHPSIRENVFRKVFFQGFVGGTYSLGEIQVPLDLISSPSHSAEFVGASIGQIAEIPHLKP